MGPPSRRGPPRPVFPPPPQPPHVHRRKPNEADDAQDDIPANERARGPAEQLGEDARVGEARTLVLAEGNEVVVGACPPPEREYVGEGRGSDGEEAPAQPTAADGALGGRIDGRHEQRAEHEATTVAREDDELSRRARTEQERANEVQAKNGGEEGGPSLALRAPGTERAVPETRGDDQDEQRRAAIGERPEARAREGAVPAEPGPD